MSAEHTYHLVLDPSAKKLLADNRVDLVAALREGGCDVRRSAKRPPVPSTGGSKEVVLAITAVGLTSVAIGTAVAKIIDAIGRNKKVVVTEQALVPATDAHGHVVRDAVGNPVMKWSEHARMLEATKTEQDKTTIDAKVGGESLLSFTIKGG